MIKDLLFHHVGIGTIRFDAAIEVYTRIGYDLIETFQDANLDVQVAFLQGTASPYIELISPLGPDGPLKSFLSRRILPSPYHTCYKTKNIRMTSEYLRTIGYTPLGAPRSALAFGGSLIAYYFHPATGLLELVENPPEWEIISQRNI